MYRAGIALQSQGATRSSADNRRLVVDGAGSIEMVSRNDVLVEEGRRRRGGKAFESGDELC